MTKVRFGVQLDWIWQLALAAGGIKFDIVPETTKRLTYELPLLSAPVSGDSSGRLQD
jgi:hypothetical protein